ncbi:hypothetical protein TD95_004018 [Thielaviopsis punctulata]|uniref:DDHD domain-containing protein n=1 Tax=Thielaviopsis punctulata TaxID=72032 RepID=A0A0F4Z6D8_9PEZI|nr:hypothetical protein TD95_004018 [Thielaviopsis punctulata]
MSSTPPKAKKSPPKALHSGPNCRLAPPPAPPSIASKTRPNLQSPKPNASAQLHRNSGSNSYAHAHAHAHAPLNDDNDDEPPPPIAAQFFYSSPIPIDDPLSPGSGPSAAASADPAGFKGQLRPFSRPDSNTLEKAWRALTRSRDTRTHDRIYHLRSPSPDSARYNNDLLARIVLRLARKHLDRHGSRPEVCATVLQPVSATAPVTECCLELWKDIDFELGESFCALLRRHDFKLGRERVAHDVMTELRRLLLLKTKTASTPSQSLSRTGSIASIPSTRDAGSRVSTPFLPESFRSVPRSLGEARVASKETMADLETRTRALSGLHDRDRDRDRDRSSYPSTPVHGSFGAIPATPMRPTKPTAAAIAASLPQQVSVLGQASSLCHQQPSSSNQQSGSSNQQHTSSGIASMLQQARQYRESQSKRSSMELRGNNGLDSKRNSMAALSDQEKSRPQSRDGPPETSETTRATDEYTDTAESSDNKHNLNQEVSVGLSRLHVVSVPKLVMKPIYWSPVNDVAAVMRATWFFKDSMLPVPVQVANQLEIGYRELRAWSQTWKVEVRCAVENGAAGEEKISHPLWPQDFANPNAKLPYLDEAKISSDIYCAVRCFYDEAAAEGNLPSKKAPDTPDSEEGATAPMKPYANHAVIYKDAHSAFILKPSLRPSAYYGRRPISRIVKGMTVGIPVCRGFDRAAWEKLYEKTLSPSKDETWAASAPGSASEEADGPASEAECPACAQQQAKARVTDLVLVAHGIGQKFAERVESFHFTHAINSFRRAVNIELQNPAVKAVLRPEHNGIMVLPVNWRHTLSFEDGGPMKPDDEASSSAEDADAFGLKDIEPPTIPAVRSMISDVMFDIPFYMSHHKSKMISSLIVEANRVYRLWCQNNPGFAEHGRVHLLAHSLGSAMALEILSQQPTYVPKINHQSVPSSRYFEFDTCNLLLCGSPSAFFLLLEHGTLMPRRGRTKPGADAGDVHDVALTAEAGQFGCLAVDNVYNILAKEDPIAYLLTGTVDRAYAASLRTAYLPSASVGMLQTLGATVRGWMPGGSGESGASAPSAAADETDEGGSDEATAHARRLSRRLPSQLELEIHDFSREQAAEKKAFLLNDNGQIDWYLRGSGGPLEIQYLNMLSAHTSYWTNADFIRFVCVEVGRRAGRRWTVAEMRAEKKGRQY